MSVVFNEQEFLDDYRESSVSGIRHATIIGMFIYDAHIIWDYILAPENFMGACFIRFGVVTPVFLLVIRLMSSAFAVRHLHRIVMTASIVGSTSVLLLFEMTDASNPIFRSTGIMMTMLFCMTMLRMLTRDAILYISIMSLECAGLLIYKHSDIYMVLGVLFFLGSVATLGIASTVISERLARRVYLDEKLISFERDRGDKLLENIFPNVIAERLKSGKTTIADFVPTCTILFADLSGFTLAAANMKAEDVVKELNEIYSAFDHLALIHGCEKIKTIGDSYMAVCGVPYPTKDHVQRIAELAIEIQRIGETLRFNGEPLSIRIGIHTGPVVAGVIGQSRFAYDLWGDTVNVASRMQSTAPPQSIQITEAVKTALGTEFSHPFEQRGAVTVKGKGTLDTWLIVHNSSASAIRAIV